MHNCTPKNYKLGLICVICQLRVWERRLSTSLYKLLLLILLLVRFITLTLIKRIVINLQDRMAQTWWGALLRVVLHYNVGAVGKMGCHWFIDQLCVFTDTARIQQRSCPQVSYKSFSRFSESGVLAREDVLFIQGHLCLPFNLINKVRWLLLEMLVIFIQLHLWYFIGILSFKFFKRRLPHHHHVSARRFLLEYFDLLFWLSWWGRPMLPFTLLFLLLHVWLMSL